MALIRIDPVWEIAVMANRPALLGQRYVSAETVVSFSDAAEKEAAEKQRAAAMRASRAVTKVAPAVGAKRPRRKPDASAASAARTLASGQVSAAAASSSDRPLAASGPPGVDPGADSGSGSSDSSEPESCGSSVSDEDLKHSWHTVLKSLKKYKGKAGKRGKAAATPAAEPPLVRVPAAPAAGPPLVRVPEAPAADPPLVRGPRAAPAPPGSRIVQYCGIATLSEVMGGGRIIGYGIVFAATAMSQISLAHSARSSACLARGLGPSRTRKQSYA